MTPKEYLDRYTHLRFTSPLDQSLVSAGLTNWGSGPHRDGDGVATPGVIAAEAQAFKAALRMAHHGNSNTPCGVRFTFSQRPLHMIPPWEEFLGSSIDRAFLGKASPDEIIDTLRLAMAIGRIGTTRDAHGAPPAKPNAQAYVKSFITIDCNGFAGAYFGVDGNVDIRTFADVARSRRNIGDIKPGDALVTHCTAVPHEHVAVIDEFNYDYVKRRADIAIAEWGGPLSKVRHYSVQRGVEVKQGKESRYGLGFAGLSNHPKFKGTPTFRYIFDRPSSAASLGWF